MRKFLIAFAFLASLGLVAACASGPRSSGGGDPAATAPSSGGGGSAPAASCGGSGKG